MSTTINKNENEFWLTRAQFEARRSAQTLIVGAIYHITDDSFQQATIIGNTDPTTATSGSVGQQYLDITNDKFYICKAVSGSTYTWIEIGGSNYSAGDGISITNNVITNTDHALIPSQATAQNQLADKAFVNSTVQTATANFRGSWNTWAAVPTDVNLYPVDYTGSRTPTVNDYLVVVDANGYITTGTSITIVTTATGTSGAIKVTIGGTEYDIPLRSVFNNETLFGNTLYILFDGGSWRIKGAVDIVYSGTTYPAGTEVFNFGISEEVNYSAGTAGQALSGTWRFKYSGTWSTTGKAGWLPEYQINREPLTQAQIAALNSGITSSKVATYDGYAAQIAAKSTVSVSATGTATDEVQYITIDGVEKKLAGGGYEDAVRYDTAQTLTDAQKAQAKTNIGLIIEILDEEDE